MHRVFVTEGVVLHKRGVGESNTLVLLLTRELGLVRASARSARKEVSKLRFGLEPLTHARFSLVRGRNEWKLIGVESMSRSLVSASSERRGQKGRISRLVLRLIHGEEALPELYDTVIDGLHSLSGVEAASDAEALECVLVFRIVNHLGYVSAPSALAPFLEGPLSSPELITQATVARRSLVSAINESLTATGL